MDDLELIKKLWSENKIRWTNHCLMRMRQRHITREEVSECINTGTIIRKYPEDSPCVSCLISSEVCNKILHVVVGYDSITVHIVTTYRPGRRG